ncbi:hypothetical protein NSE01_27070 [Novosphingobium sediminis]|uniref:Uncharacterized protein n=1 Tax=Novosphingobium sediminis TaxID=707214 RepID=A0A512AME1_9SPHN|nr:hypothetical protein [Novosphingobium sediminis]GEO00875.1 hypothetical protein NSE01_27070 [Novosphingobium sediminis]
MTTPENHDRAPAERITRPEAARTAPQRKPSTGVPPEPVAEPAAPAPDPGTHDKDVHTVNEAVASSVRSAYDVLSETIGQGRKAAEQFRVGAYNVRDVPDDVRHMAANLLGLARQLSSATFDICEALLRQADGMMTPPPPGSTHVPAFHAPKVEPAPHHAAPKPAPHHAAALDELHLHVQFNGKHTARAHTKSVARPQVPTGADQIACDSLVAHGGGAAPITSIAFELHPTGHGLAVMVIVPHDQPKGIYVGPVYCSTQPLPLGQLVIEIE